MKQRILPKIEQRFRTRSRRIRTRYPRHCRPAGSWCLLARCGLASRGDRRPCRGDRGGRCRQGRDPRPCAQARDIDRQRPGRSAGRDRPDGRGGAGRVRRGVDARSAAQPRARARNQGDRSHRPDPRDFRRTGCDRRRPASGRARAPRLSGRPPRSQLDPSRTPARRLRLPRRPRRNPDRGRSPPDPRSHGSAAARTRPGQPDTGPAPRAASARALAGDRAGRLYQCRKIYAFQSTDGR